MTDDQIIALWREHKAVMSFAHALLAAEREECAKVCEENADDLSEGDWDSACINCAENIRARGRV